MSLQQSVDSVPELVLCQDCLSINYYSDARHDGAESCVCGGDYCGCPDCRLEALILLTTTMESLMKMRLLVCDSYRCNHIFKIPMNASPAQIQTLVCPVCNERVSISKKRKS